MDNREDILTELQLVSPFMANLGNKNVYSIPEAYFESFPEHMNVTVSLKEKEILPTWQKPVENAPFIVPEAYFGNFPEILLKRIKSSEAASHKDEIELISPLLGKLDRSLPFSLPNNYFQDLAGDIMSGVNAVEYVNSELEIPSEIMHATGSENVYKVPEGYFNSLSQDLLTTVKGRQRGKLFSITSSKKVLRLSMAALIAGVISFSAWIFFRDTTAAAGADITGIEKVSNDEIETYLESSSVTSDGSNEDNSIASFDMKDDDVKELLADVPDEELKQYLEQQSVTKDMNTN